MSKATATRKREQERKQETLRRREVRRWKYGKEVR